MPKIKLVYVTYRSGAAMKTYHVLCHSVELAFSSSDGPRRVSTDVHYISIGTRHEGAASVLLEVRHGLVRHKVGQEDVLVS